MRQLRLSYHAGPSGDLIKGLILVGLNRAGFYNSTEPYLSTQAQNFKTWSSSTLDNQNSFNSQSTMPKLIEIEAKISVTMTKHKMSATQISERINWFGTRSSWLPGSFFPELGSSKCHRMFSYLDMKPTARAGLSFSTSSFEPYIVEDFKSLSLGPDPIKIFLSNFMLLWNLYLLISWELSPDYNQPKRMLDF